MLCNINPLFPPPSSVPSSTRLLDVGGANIPANRCCCQMSQPFTTNLPILFKQSRMLRGARSSQQHDFPSPWGANGCPSEGSALGSLWLSNYWKPLDALHPANPSKQPFPPLAGRFAHEHSCHSAPQPRGLGTEASGHRRRKHGEGKEVLTIYLLEYLFLISATASSCDRWVAMVAGYLEF